MTNKLKFVWIDDTPDRADKWKESFSTLRSGTHVEADVEVIALTQNFLIVLEQRATEVWDKNPPDLIILDHNLQKVTNRPFGMHGSALAHLIRNQLDGTPIVCVSAQKINSDDFNSEDISEYTYIFDIEKLNSESNMELIFSIAQDFKKICYNKKSPIRYQLLDTLAVPASDRSSLLSVLPEEFESQFLHGTSPHRIARWILNVLMHRPGYLVDALEAATLLGIKEESFTEKVAVNFDAARYRGPFATDSHPLWWASLLMDVLYQKLPHCDALASQEAGRCFPGVTEQDFSVCGFTGQHTPPPDVVAHVDATPGSNRIAVRHGFTVPFSDEAGSILGFSTKLRIRNERKGG
jgi:CheY-like chemotaxis protein